MTWVVWGGLALVIAFVALIFVRTPVAAVNKPLPVIGQIPDFHLTNQNNEAVSLASLRGKVWVADLIFTRCAGACPAMTGQLAELQAELTPDQAVRLVSFTSDPANDTPAVLKKYADKSTPTPAAGGSSPARPRKSTTWRSIDFKFVVVEKKPEERACPRLVLHSTWFALVDQQGRTRGWVDQEGHEHAVFESDDADAMTACGPPSNNCCGNPRHDDP